MRWFPRNKDKQQPLSEERRKEFFEYGQRISRKLGIPEKVQRTNAFYARHPKAMSFAIFGFCCLLLVVSEVCLRSSGMPMHKPVGEQPSDYTASTLFEAMEMHSSSMDKLNGIAEQYDRLRTVVDSLQTLENPTAEDSARLTKGRKLLKQIEGDADNGH